VSFLSLALQPPRRRGTLREERGWEEEERGRYRFPSRVRSCGSGGWAAERKGCWH